jgi:hypothetical protein
VKESAPGSRGERVSQLARACLGHDGPLPEASPLELSLGFYGPLDRGLPLSPAVFFRDASIESVKPSKYLPTPLHAHRRVPFVPFFRAALASAARSRTPWEEACEIAADRRSRPPNKRLHLAAREWVTGVQHPGKCLVTRERIDGETERLDWRSRPRAFSLPCSSNLVEDEIRSRTSALRRS